MRSRAIPRPAKVKSTSISPIRRLRDALLKVAMFKVVTRLRNVAAPANPILTDWTMTTRRTRLRCRPLVR
jgi:hypothetical protein